MCGVASAGSLEQEEQEQLNNLSIASRFFSCLDDSRNDNDSPNFFVHFSLLLFYVRTTNLYSLITSYYVTNPTDDVVHDNIHVYLEDLMTSKANYIQSHKNGHLLRCRVK